MNVCNIKNIYLSDDGLNVLRNKGGLMRQLKENRDIYGALFYLAKKEAISPENNPTEALELELCSVHYKKRG